MAANLPKEILTAIFEYVAPSCVVSRTHSVTVGHCCVQKEYPADVRSLLSLCQVSRNWSSAAQYVLYRRITLRDVLQADKLLLTLENRPDLACAVNTLELELSRYESRMKFACDVKNCHQANPRFKRLLQMLSKLQSYTLDLVNVVALCPATLHSDYLPGHQPVKHIRLYISYVYIHGPDFEEDEVWPLSDDYIFPPSLECLELHSATVLNDTPAFPAALRELCINGTALRSLIPQHLSSFPSLQVLSLVDCDRLDVLEFLRYGRSAITRLVDFSSANEHEDVSSYSETLQLLPALQYLEIDYPSLPQETLLALPLTLQKLAWNRICDAATILGLLELLCDPSFLPRLVHIPCIYAWDDLSDWAEGIAPYEAIKKAAERARKACNARGLAAREYSPSFAYDHKAVLPWLGVEAMDNTST